MSIKARAIWENGQLRLLDDIQMPEGQTVILEIKPLPDSISKLREVLAKWARLPDPSWHDEIPFDEDALQAEIDRLIPNGMTLSDIIIEDREDRI